MKTTTKLVIAAIIALAALIFVDSSRAQQQVGPAGPPQVGPAGPQGDAQAQADNGPQPGVSRLSFLRGDVSLQRGDSGDTSAVDLNTPLAPGDKIFTGPGARAEIQLDWANTLRLDQNAQATIATVEGNRIQVQLAQGVASYSMMPGSDAAVEIDTPNVSITPRRNGRYRIEVTAAGDTLVSVRDGDADVSTPDGSTQLHRGDLITVRGMGSDTQFQITAARGEDEFDRWSADRDRLISDVLNSGSNHTNQYYTGAADLNAYGQWDNTDDYGWVWEPRVAIGWAPYRQGRWVWEPYWGWTWTSYEPWGWAPYHYGRWFVRGSSWVWWPGPVTRFYRPVYAPAYVSFFGFGARSGFSVGVGFGGFGAFGWLPAGPGDYINPWWGGRRGEFGVVNVTNIYNVRGGVIAPLRGNGFSNVHNMLSNNQVRYGMSAVSAENFGHGRAMTRTVSAAELNSGHLMTGNVPVVPSRDSLRTSDRAAIAGAGANRAQGQGQQRFFSRQGPPAQRESFAAESTYMQQSMGAAANRGAAGAVAGRNGSAPEMNSQLRTPQAQVRAQAPAAEADRFNGNSQGIQRVTPGGNTFAGQGSGAAATGRAVPAAPNAPTEGWQRFSGGPPRGSSSFVGQGQGQSNGGQPNAHPAPQTGGRPQLELSRPIIQPRSYTPPAANNYRSYAPAPRSEAPAAAPRPSYSGGGGGRPAPGGSSGGGRPSGGGGGGARSSGSHASGHR